MDHTCNLAAGRARAFAVEGDDGITKIYAFSDARPIGSDAESLTKHDLSERIQVVQIWAKTCDALCRKRETYRSNTDKVATNDESDECVGGFEDDELGTIGSEVEMGRYRERFDVEIRLKWGTVAIRCGMNGIRRLSGKPDSGSIRRRAPWIDESRPISTSRPQPIGDASVSSRAPSDLGAAKAGCSRVSECRAHSRAPVAGTPKPRPDTPDPADRRSRTCLLANVGQQ